MDLLAAPTAAGAAVAEQMDANAKAGRQRITAEWAIKAKEAEGKYDVFLSHNSKDKAAVEEIARRLKSVGIRPWLDKWDLVPGETVMEALEKAIKTIKCGVLFFGPADVGRWHIMEIRSYVESKAGKEARFISVIPPGVEDKPELPPFVAQALWLDMRDWSSRTVMPFTAWSAAWWASRRATRRVQSSGQGMFGIGRNAAGSPLGNRRKGPGYFTH